MTDSSPKGSLGTALVFSLIALAASPAGLLGTGRGLQPPEPLPEGGGVSFDGSFHRKVGLPELPDPAPFCLTCHPRPPHPGGGTSPAFLNQHSVIFDCFVCHWGKTLGSQPDLAWERRPVKGGGGDGGETLVLGVAEDLQEGKRDPAALRQRVTASRVCFERGPACGACHGEGRLGKYTRPGMSPVSEEALENLQEIFLLPEGEKWYFPR